MRTKFLFRFLTSSVNSINRSLSTATETRTQKLERIADELLDLNKLERHDYAVLFRHKMGLNRYGPAVSGQVLSGTAGPGSGSSDVKPAAAEKTAFDIKLEKFDAAAKIKIIKEVRSFTDLGLKEAKDLVEKAPVVLKKGLTKDEANPIVEKLKELGATVENPLMGWTSTGDPYANVGDSALYFDSEESAKSLAERHGWEWRYTVRKGHIPLFKAKSCADNFSSSRVFQKPRYNCITRKIEAVQI